MLKKHLLLVVLNMVVALNIFVEKNLWNRE